MRLVKWLWQAADAAGTFAWVVAVFGGVTITLLATIYGAFEGLPKLAQVVVAILVFALASVVFLEVVQYGRLQAGRRRKPQLRVYVEDGPDFRFSVAEPLKDGLAGTLKNLIPEFPDPKAEHYWRLCIREMGNAPASKVRARIIAVDPPLQGHSLPLPLYFWAEDKARDFDRGDQAFVNLMYVAVCDERVVIFPPLPVEDGPVKIEVEVYYGDKDTQAEVRSFLIPGPEERENDPNVRNAEGQSGTVLPGETI